MASSTKQYVVWDGIIERPYVDDPNIHDCMVCTDFKLLSVQSPRRYVFKLGHEPILIFACDGGTAAFDDDFDDGGGGVFTHFFAKVFTNEPAITLRDSIRKVNREILDAGYDQRCEVFCLREFLDIPGFLPFSKKSHDRELSHAAKIIAQYPTIDDNPERDVSHSGGKVLIMCNMCRTPWPEIDRKSDIGMFDRI